MTPLPLLASALLALAPAAAASLTPLDLLPVPPIEAPSLKLQPPAARPTPTPAEPELRWPGFPGLWALGPVLPRALAVRPPGRERGFVWSMPMIAGDENVDRRMPLKAPEPGVDYKLLMNQLALAPAR